MRLAAVRPLRLPGSISQVTPSLFHPHTRSQSNTSALSFDADSQPTTTREDGSRTLRVRQHGNRHLPLPTILDPLAIRARTKHELPKARRSDDVALKTSFQRELSTNVYAHILASPIRDCLLTKARLPTQLLIPFVQNRMVHEPTQTVKPSLVPAIDFNTAQRKSYVLATQDAINQLSGQKGKWPLLVNETWKRKHALRVQKSIDNIKVGKEWDLRYGENTTHVVHEKLGSNVVNTLKWCIEHESPALIVPYSDGVLPNSIACVIHLGDHIRQDDQHIAGQQMFELSHLLQHEQMQRLRELLSKGVEVFSLLKQPQTIITHLALMKLRNFLDEQVECHG